ncbi:Hypothetical protein PACV_61 [Pacmanvirus A23]|uniref:Hypothetical protein n=1 Tax=Pacmanvirus A23 TaxID=1932881 RepID=UPI000A092E54|nr:Hypothetical protein B9W72_gp061 [Pacmanvirus A23]SIP85778.1 Hypothetical protein PACV_61 [Pacmanvirus A23]
MTATNNDSANKLSMLFKPMLDDTTKLLKEFFTAQTQEVLIAIARVEARVDVLEKLVGGIKKPAARGEKKAAATATEATPNGEAVAQPAAAEKKSFATNKLVYFRDQFKTNENYRKKYLKDEMEELVAKDASIASKKTDEQKLVATATFCWNYFKTNKPETIKAIEEEYAAAKAKHEADNKPAQQAAEPHTPTE